MGSLIPCWLNVQNYNQPSLWCSNDSCDPVSHWGPPECVAAGQGALKEGVNRRVDHVCLCDQVHLIARKLHDIHLGFFDILLCGLIPAWGFEVELSQHCEAVPWSPLLVWVGWPEKTYELSGKLQTHDSPAGIVTTTVSTTGDASTVSVADENDHFCLSLQVHTFCGRPASTFPVCLPLLRTHRQFIQQSWGAFLASFRLAWGTEEGYAEVVFVSPLSENDGFLMTNPVAARGILFCFYLTSWN